MRFLKKSFFLVALKLEHHGEKQQSKDEKKISPFDWRASTREAINANADARRATRWQKIRTTEKMILRSQKCLHKILFLPRTENTYDPEVCVESGPGGVTT
jgi:hypothetical protein